ncbi:hypothetical protein KKF82_09145 [Patescibacteria group bacterium]|uniref:Uncharacterized protein n=1 Tax=viral metagenome TaxID=1070528 RepID=A0A6M3M2Y2_9ZZZZ|nr:hypothetical protein [Patescibacteria group bacterium]
MPDLYIFKAQIGMFDPIALYDHNVAIHYVQNVYYRKVDFLEGISPFQCVNIGAVAAVSPSARVQIPNLEMANGEFGLFRWYPIDDAQVRFYHPAGIAKAQLRNLQVPVDMNILFRDPNLVSTEIAVWENNRPAAEAINGHAFGLAAVRLIALGYRFHSVEITGAVTLEERKVVEQLKAEHGNQNKKEVDLLIKAYQEKRLPITHVWCSGRAIGD